MAEVAVKLMKLRQSPRKVRLVADLVRTKPVAAAATTLNHLEKRAAKPLGKLLKSAIAAALGKNLDKDKLKIKELRVDEGPSMKRFLPAPRGRSYRITKRTAHITLILSDENDYKSNKKQLTSNNVKK